MAQVRRHPVHAPAGPGDPEPRIPPLRVVETPRPDPDAPTLTRRKRQCLGWCAEGKSYWETAVILGISERTVSFHMEAVRSKLGADSNAHAVAMALMAGLLEAGAGKARARRQDLR